MCFSTYTNFELTYAKISKFSIDIFRFWAKDSPSFVSKIKSLGCSFN